MKKLNIVFSKDESKDKEIKKTIFCIVMVIVSSVIYSLGIIWFITPATLYSGGVTGIAQLVVSFFDLFKIRLDLGILVFLFNVPILMYGWKAVSKRFVICSVISIGIQTLLLSNFMSELLFVPLDINVAPLNDTNRLILAFIGGFVCGFGSALALRVGTSTGGIDVLAQAIAFKKKISIGYTSLIINVLIAIVGAIITKQPTVFFFTIVRIISQSVVTDRVHTTYNFLKVEIITENGVLITEEVMQQLHRGMTLIPGKGAYTHNDKEIVEIVVSSYEVQKIVEIVKKIDQHAFITVTPIKTIFGNFARRTVA